MFRSKENVFAKVKCPDFASKNGCSVVNCLFDHGSTKRKASSEEPNSKRLKVIRPDEHVQSILKDSNEATIEEKDVQLVVPMDLTTGLVIPRVERMDNVKKIAHFLKSKHICTTPNKLAINKEYEFALTCNSLDEYREVVGEFLGIRGRRVPASDLIRIQPIEVNPSPAMLPVRRRYIELFVEAIKRQNPELQVPIWTATEEEYKIASTNTSTTYNVAVKKKLYLINHPEKSEKGQSQSVTKEQYLRELRGLCIEKEKLAKFGFVMEVPESITEPEPVRICHRCKLEFKLEDADKECICQYHSGKIIKSELNERKYLCCGGVIGATDTIPCCESKHHVFYWLNPQEMNHFLPFVETKSVWGIRKGSLEAAGIDCEMGFTTKGFELLRVTVVDFFTGEEVFDILVKPKGKVLDLNTRWSGIAEIKEEAMSFEDSITLLGEVLDSKTVLIGHGLENDMNAMRLIHHSIVDTAVLYPKHKATPTFRFSLKQLCFQYLGRNIQSGEHDSAEDSLAAIDVCKYFIKKDLERTQRRVSR